MAKLLAEDPSLDLRLEAINDFSTSEGSNGGSVAGRGGGEAKKEG